MTWLRQLFGRGSDPVHSCRVHREIGCAHVDGMLCDMPTCGILKGYLNEHPTNESATKEVT